MRRPSEETARGIRAVGIAVCLAALAASPPIAGRLLSPDGSLGESTRLALHGAQAAAALLALVLFARAASVARLLGRLQESLSEGRDLRIILVLGIFLRVLVQAFLDPSNNDPHWSYVRFLVEHHRPPFADEVLLGFQPPLYYLLAAPLAAIGSMKLTQGLSLLLSLANLLLIARWVRDTRLFESAAARRHALLLAAILPQFLLFSGFVSNDALAYPLGTLALVLALRYVEAPSLRAAGLLGLVAGLGLVTKGTLIGNVPVLVLAILAGTWTAGRAWRASVAPLALFGVLTVLVGGYKFVENQIHFGTPVVGNDILHQDWVHEQEGTWQGPSSLLDVNVLKLARNPSFSESTRHSIPLLLYGTFWSAYIPESNWNRTRAHPFKILIPLLDLAGVLPTLLILVGLAAKALAARVLLRRDPPPARDTRIARAQDLLLGCAIAAATLLVLKWGLKHDAWSFFQARLVFPAFLSIAAGLGFGVDLVRRGGPVARALVGAGLLLVYLLIAAYFAVEIGSQIAHPTHWPPLPATS
ncbi:MAG TPA: hypothetical protein ENJ09_13655 [Planctomycetes bacterium]|nr:hypothetical protein [Planctomycetota bacterium]